MMMSGVAGRDRAAETVMRDVRRAVAADAQAGGGTSNRDAAIARAANVVARSVVAHYGGGPDVQAKVVAAMTEAMKTGDTSKITALKRQLQGIAASAARALTLYGLTVVDQVEMWGGLMPALASPAANFAHVECNLSVFCRNPLHPGPCKGWKGTLAKVAPGTLKLIEEERKSKLAAKAKAKAAAQAKAKKIVDAAKRGAEVDEHPNAKKKLAAKATAQILGTEEGKVAEIEGKTKLTQKEMAWHANKKAAALLAANIAAGNLQSKAAQAKYRQTVRAQILAALKADNESGLTGPESEYQKVLNGWSSALSIGHADQHVKPQTEAGDDLHGAVADAFHAAVLEDVKNAKAGHQGVNMKKLTKALKEIPGEPGDPEHDAAVGQAVGHDVSPDQLVDAADAAKKAKAAETGKIVAAIAGVMGLPEQQKAMAEANITKLMESDDPNAQKKLEQVLSKMAINLGNQLAPSGHPHFGTGMQAQIQKKVQAEINEMLASGSLTPPPGGILAAMSMPKGEERDQAIVDILEAEGVGLALKPDGVEWQAKKKGGPAVADPGGQAGGPAGGGAGAGGLTKAQASSNVVSEIDDLVNDGPSGDSQALLVQSTLNDPYESDAEKALTIKKAAEAKAKQLLDKIGAGLTDDEREELEQIVAGMVEAAITDPKHAPGAVNMIKNLKKKSPADLKDFAHGILPPNKAKKAAEADKAAVAAKAAPKTSNAGHLLGKTPSQAAAQIAGKAKEAYEKLLPPGVGDGSALTSPSAVAKLTQTIDNSLDPEAAAASAAKALAKSFLKGKLGGSSMQPLHEAALQDALANEIYEGMVTGTFPEGGLLSKVGDAKFGFVKLKIAAKKEFDKTGGLPSGPGAKKTGLPPTTSSKQQALDDALDDAFGPVGAPAGPPASPPEKLVKFANVPGGAAAALLANRVQEYEAEMAAAKTEEEKQAAVAKLAGSLAGAHLGHMFNELDLSLGDMDMTQLAEVSKKLRDDYAAALAAGADEPAGLAGKLPAIMASVNKAAEAAKKANGFSDGSPALNNYKQALVEAELDAEINSTAPIVMNAKGGAGAGGTGTGVNPATPATTPPIKITTGVKDVTPAPKKKTKALPQAGKAPDLTGVKKVGEQGGFNKGGTYQTPAGKKLYIKQQQGMAQARNEATAAALYRAAGIDIPAVSVQEGQAADLAGVLTSTEIVEGATPFDAGNPAHVQALRRGFAVDAWLANWDAVGADNFNNVLIGPDGEPFRVDAGGAMEFGGAGGPKGANFGDTVGEIETLRDPSINPAMAQIFGGMTDDELIDSLEQVEKVTPAKIRAIVKAQGGDPALADKLIARRADMMKKLKKLRQEKKAKAVATLTGLPESTLTPANVGLAGTKKKQKIYKPQPGHTFHSTGIHQVVMEGQESNVAEYNARVAASAQRDEAARVPAQMADVPVGPRYNSLYAYSDGSWAINDHLRGGGQPSPNPPTNVSNMSSEAAAPDQIAHLDRQFEESRLPQAITVMRGVPGSEKVFGKLWTEHRDRNWTGAEFQDLAYTSTTISDHTVDTFKGASPNSVVMRVLLPAGTRAINLGSSSSFSNEAEILLNRGARFRIVADNGMQGGDRHIDVEVICDGPGCAS